MRDKDSSGHSSHNDVVRTAFWMPLSLLLATTGTPPAPPNPPTPSMERRNVRKRSSLPQHCFLNNSHRSFPTFSDTGSYNKRLATSALLCTKCCSKGSHHAFAKFLNPRNTYNSNSPPRPPQPLPFSLSKTSRSRSASISSKNIRRSVDLVFLDSCLRIHSQNEGRTHQDVLPKWLPKVILLLHLSAICLSSDCRRPRRVPPLQLLEILPHPAHGRFSVRSRRLLSALTSSTFFATSSPNLVAASCPLSALFPPLKRTPQPWATEKSGTSVSDELLLLDFFNLLLFRLSSRSPFLFAPATHRLAVADQIPLLLSTLLLILPLSSPLPCLLTLPLLFPCATLISP